MAGSAAEEQIILRILVDEEKNRVVFAQAGKDFVDVLLSFLTFPLGTIARLVSKESNINKVSVGCLSSLYESVANLDVNHFWTETCKEMLLQPRNPMESYCRSMKLNIDDTENIKYFICENWECSRKSYGGLLSTFKNKRCKCGKLMNREISLEDGVNISNNEGFIPDMATFIISDDLKVMPDNFQTTFSLSMNLGYENFDEIKVVTVNVTRKEMVALLKCSLFSKTSLTDFLLKNKPSSPTSALVFNIDEPEVNVGQQVIKVRLMLRKSNRKILFALAEEDFVDFLFSFMTFPLGGVEKMLKGNSCLGNIDNLYKSVVDLDGHRYLSSPYLKDKLVNPGVAKQFRLWNQILPIHEEPISNYYCYTKFCSLQKMFCGHLTTVQHRTGYHETNNNREVCESLSYLEPQSSTGDSDTYSSYVRRGFIKRPSLYMVTDDLVITPSSSLSAFSFLKEARISPSDVEERVISIGKNEGLSLLKASLISASALTDGLSQVIKPIKEEKGHEKQFVSNGAMACSGVDYCIEDCEQSPKRLRREGS